MQTRDMPSNGLDEASGAPSRAAWVQWCQRLWNHRAVDAVLGVAVIGVVSLALASVWWQSWQTHGSSSLTLSTPTTTSS